MNSWYDKNQYDLEYYFHKIINLLNEENIPIDCDYENMYQQYINFVFSHNIKDNKINTFIPVTKLPKFKSKLTKLPN